MNMLAPLSLQKVCMDVQFEVMKMLMPLTAPAAGVLAFNVTEGGVVGAGDLIGRLDLDNPNAVVSWTCCCSGPHPIFSFLSVGHAAALPPTPFSPFCL